MLINIPPALERLPELAGNLWWGWHPEARALFETLESSVSDPPHHNPVELLYRLPPEELKGRASDPESLDQYRQVLAAIGVDMLAEKHKRDGGNSS